MVDPWNLVKELELVVDQVVFVLWDFLLHFFDQILATVVELVLADTGEGAVVGRNDLYGGEAASNERNFSEVLSCIEIFVVHIVIIFIVIVIDHDSALTRCNEVKIPTNLSLVDDNVIWLNHVRHQV